jgi:hypothetical protein
MRRLLAASAVLMLASLAGADEYLKDGKLTHTLVVKDLQSGFAGQTGPQYTITPSGEWEEARVTGRNVKVVQKGKLTKKQLTALAGELKKYDPATLKDTGKVSVNPHVVTIQYGKHSAKLNLKAGAALPPAGTKTADGRFAGVVEAVRAAIAKKK